MTKRMQWPSTKHLVLLWLLLLGIFSSYAQRSHLRFHLSEGGNPVPNYPVWIETSNNSFSYYTDANGNFADSILQTVPFSITYFTYDCSGQKVKRTITHTQSASLYHDSIFLSCSRIPPFWQASFNYNIPSGLNPREVQFVNNSTLSALDGIEVSYELSLGDGNRITQATSLHTYPNFGSYVACLRLFAIDTVGGRQDTLFTEDDCQNIILKSSGSCTANFSFNSLNNQFHMVNFTNTSTTTVGIPNGDIKYTWLFGDGIFSFQRDPLHSYATNGTYNVCLVQVVEDTLNNIEYCRDTICKTVVVNYQAPVCTANFIVDTANSYFGKIIGWNTSMPLPTNPEYSINYMWYFGDGDSSELAFPIHQYQQPGMYQLCLTITTFDSINNKCQSTFCDSIGADQYGNLIYKNSATAFTLNIMDPQSIGIVESDIDRVQVYPNPASNFVEVKFSEFLNEKFSWRLYNMGGILIKESGNSPLNGDGFSVDISTLEKGIYLFQIIDSRNYPISCIKLSVEK